MTFNQTKREPYDITACYNLCIAVIENAWNCHCPECLAFVKNGWITRAAGIEAKDLEKTLTKRRLAEIMMPGLEVPRCRKNL